MAIRDAAFVVVAACSGRKRVPQGGEFVPLDPFTCSTGPSSHAPQWIESLRRASSLRPARDVYLGRNSRLAQDAASFLAVDLFFVSAGLGLISASQPIPIYEATITERKNVARFFGLSESEWWRFLMDRSPYVAKWPSPHLTVLLAAPVSYIRMIAPHLEMHPIEKLRIFTRGDISRFPTDLQRAVMPYDARFDGPDSPIPGTISDFHARSLTHFVREILPKSSELGLQEHRALVDRAKAGWTSGRRSPGRSVTDDEIQNLIRAYAPKLRYRSTIVLRYLRDELLVACEQKRFQRLFRTVAQRDFEQSCLPM